MSNQWQCRGRRLCPRRRPWRSAAIAERSALLGSLQAVYRQMASDRHEHEAAANALAGRRKRDFDAGLYALDGHLHRDELFRRFVAERTGTRPRTRAEVDACWPEPEVRR